MKINQIFCKHQWVRLYKVQTYFDYSGFKVYVYKCMCSKCLKKKNKKFW